MTRRFDDFSRPREPSRPALDTFLYFVVGSAAAGALIFFELIFIGR